MIEVLAGAKALIIIVWFAVLAALERLARASPHPPHVTSARLFRNIGLWLVNTALNPLLVIAISAPAAAATLWVRPPVLTGWSGLVFDILVLDLWIYFWHRANHVAPLLWRFHQVHHRDEFLDTTSAVRFHPGEVILSACVRALVIIAFAIPLPSIVVFETLVLVVALFHHSNVRMPKAFEAALRMLIVTPAHHWVHHHAVRAHTDSNYATLLTLWDRLFGTWCPYQRESNMTIGAEGATDRSFLRLLLTPFARSAS